MATLERARINSDKMQRRAAILAQEAGEAGDDFLQYLFEMAILHLDEQARDSPAQRVQGPAVDDPRIAQAANLIHSMRDSH